jgi:hypothetical protein
MAFRARLLCCLAVLAAIATPHAAFQEAGKATVYVYRPGKFTGKGANPMLFVDDKKVAKADNARYFALRLDPGNHVIRTSHKESALDQSWDAGKVYFVRVLPVQTAFGGHFETALATERQARADMMKLKPLDNDDVEGSAAHLVVLDELK